MVSTELIERSWFLFVHLHLHLFAVLTPVNEYNIVDKIQSANSLLFDAIEPYSVMEFKQTSTLIGNTVNKSDKLLLQSKHRVTFSSDIEEYEDEASEADSAEVQYKDDDEIEKEIAEIIERDQPSVESTDSLPIDGLIKRMSMSEVDSNDDDTVSDDYATELEVVDELIVEDDQNTDIFEEFTKPDETTLSEPIDEEYSILQTFQANGQTKPPFNGKISATNGNSEACNACNRATTASARYTTKSAGMKRPATAQIHRIASADSTYNHRRMNKEQHQDDLLKIHLNIRSCCENKYLDNNRLPRYNGYISQYGLSKDQLEMRESNRQKFIEKKARREREIMRAKQQIYDLNEKAFQQWLIRKNRMARPKYKNMYDSAPQKPQIKFNSATKSQRSSINNS